MQIEETSKICKRHVKDKNPLGNIVVEFKSLEGFCYLLTNSILLYRKFRELSFCEINENGNIVVHFFFHRRHRVRLSFFNSLLWRKWLQKDAVRDYNPELRRIHYNDDLTDLLHLVFQLPDFKENSILSYQWKSYQYSIIYKIYKDYEDNDVGVWEPFESLVQEDKTMLNENQLSLSSAPSLELESFSPIDLSTHFCEIPEDIEIPEELKKETLLDGFKLELETGRTEIFQKISTAIKKTSLNKNRIYVPPENTENYYKIINKMESNRKTLHQIKNEHPSLFINMTQDKIESLSSLEITLQKSGVFFQKQNTTEAYDYNFAKNCKLANVEERTFIRNSSKIWPVDFMLTNFGYWNLNPEIEDFLRKSNTSIVRSFQRYLSFFYANQTSLKKAKYRSSISRKNAVRNLNNFFQDQINN